MKLTPRTKNILFWSLFAANVIGFFAGYILVYAEPISAAPLYLALFIPDCPLAALLFAIALVLVRAQMTGTLSELFKFLACVMCFKYGFWTVFVLLYYSPFYFATPYIAFMNGAFLVSHVWMFFQPLLLASYVRVRLWHVVPVLAFLLLSDYSDYVLLTYPPLPESGLPLMYPLTVAMSIAFTFAGYYILKNAKRPLLPIIT